jgi:hypothetical protein
MAAQFTAFNCLPDATTGMMSATSYTTGAKVALQLAPASGSGILIVEYGVSFGGTAAGTPSVVTLAAASAATTGLTAHSTSSIMNVGSMTKTSTLQMGTALSGYGAVAIVSNTTQRQYAGAQVAPTTQYEKQFPLGRDYLCPSGSYLQLRINTAATLTAIAYIVFEEV